MTKKDYELIAKVVKDINERKATGYRIAELFANELVSTNSRFNKETFLRACGVFQVNSNG